LLTYYKYIKNIKDFFVGSVEMDVALLVLLGKELYDVVLQYESIAFGFQSGKQKFLDFGVIYNWVKWSIFFGSFLIGRLISFHII